MVVMRPAIRGRARDRAVPAQGPRTAAERFLTASIIRSGTPTERLACGRRLGRSLPPRTDADWDADIAADAYLHAGAADVCPAWGDARGLTVIATRDIHGTDLPTIAHALVLAAGPGCRMRTLGRNLDRRLAVSIGTIIGSGVPDRHDAIRATALAQEAGLLGNMWSGLTKPCVGGLLLGTCLVAGVEPTAASVVDLLDHPGDRRGEMWVRMAGVMAIVAAARQSIVHRDRHGLPSWHPAIAEAMREPPATALAGGRAPALAATIAVACITSPATTAVVDLLAGRHGMAVFAAIGAATVTT